MTIKSISAAVAVAAGMFAFNNNADAQVIVSHGYSSYTPGVVYSSGYTPVYSNAYVYPSSGVIVGNSYATPYNSGYYGNPYGSSYYGSQYTNGYYGNNSLYGNSVYSNSRYSNSVYGNSMMSPYSNVYTSGYNNLYNSGAYGLGIGTQGLTYGGRRIGRW